MSEIQANCPHCGTSFTVNTEQLSVANGHVRCGVCMKVFKAADTPEQQAPAKETAPPTPETSPDSSKVALDDDASIEAWIKKNQKTGNKNIQSGPVAAPENIEKESLSFDDEISDAFEQIKPAGSSGSKDFTALIEEDEKEEPSLSLQVDENTESAKSTLDTEDFYTEDSTSNKNDFNDDDFVDSFNDDLFSSDDDEEPVIQVALGSTEIEDEPSFESKLNPNLLWPSITAVFSLILLLQLTVKNFDEYATEPGFRGIYSVFCSIGLCTLPPLSNVESIRGSNLIVRPHPELNNALMVDAIINNRASFDQAFPDLFLSFSNIQGKVIASRQFKPEEYLQGELEGLSSMPSRTPLHLSMEVVDPGNEAVSYHLDFVPGS